MADYLPIPIGWPNNLSIQKCTISTAGMSEAVAVQGKALVGLIMPAAWTAASIQFYASIDGSAFQVVKDTTTASFMQTIPAADDWIVFPLADALFASYIKLASVTAGGVTPVVQGAAREIKLIFRNFLD